MLPKERKGPLPLRNLSIRASRNNRPEARVPRLGRGLVAENRKVEPAPGPGAIPSPCPLRYLRGAGRGFPRCCGAAPPIRGLRDVTILPGWKACSPHPFTSEDVWATGDDPRPLIGFLGKADHLHPGLFQRAGLVGPRRSSCGSAPHGAGPSIYTTTWAGVR